MAGAAGPASRCEFQLGPLSKGAFLAGQAGTESSSTKGVVCFGVSPAVPLLSFAALFIPLFHVGSFYFIHCGVFFFVCLFICSFICFLVFVFFFSSWSKAMKSYSWSKFLKKRPQGNSGCLNFTQGCNWNQREPWGIGCTR